MHIFAKSKCQGNMHLPRDANMQKICILDMHFQHVDMHYLPFSLWLKGIS